MILKAIVPKIGNPEQYIGKPFYNENHEVIGKTIDCQQKENNFELTIDAELNINQNQSVSLSIGKDDFNMNKCSPVNELIFDTKEDGEEVIDGLNKTMETYGTVSVADLYDLSGLVCNYKDHKYGWLDVSSAKVSKCKHGYLLQIVEPNKFK